MIEKEEAAGHGDLAASLIFNVNRAIDVEQLTPRTPVIQAANARRFAVAWLCARHAVSASRAALIAHLAGLGGEP